MLSPDVKTMYFLGCTLKPVRLSCVHNFIVIHTKGLYRNFTYGFSLKVIYDVSMF